MRLPCLFLCFWLIAACTPLPDLDDTIPPGTESADYVELLPLDPILARAKPTTPDAEANARALEARVAALNKRADALRNGTLN